MRIPSISACLPLHLSESLWAAGVASETESPFPHLQTISVAVAVPAAGESVRSGNTVKCQGLFLDAPTPPIQQLLGARPLAPCKVNAGLPDEFHSMGTTATLAQRRAKRGAGAADLDPSRSTTGLVCLCGGGAGQKSLRKNRNGNSETLSRRIGRRWLVLQTASLETVAGLRSYGSRVIQHQYPGPTSGVRLPLR